MRTSLFYTHVAFKEQWILYTFTFLFITNVQNYTQLYTTTKYLKTQPAF